jgi:D-alanyl-D-alanine carboxypeptidase
VILNKKNKITIFFVFMLAIYISNVPIVQEKKQKSQGLFIQKFFKYENTQRNFQEVIDNTTAESVIVYDLSQDRILGSKNIEKKYSLASLTKIVTAVVVYEKDKNLLKEIREMLKTSSNPESEKLALVFGPDEKTQVEYMNNFAKKYNLYFRNVSGLDIEIDTEGNRIAGGEGKPLDLINFIKEYYLKYPELFDETILKENNTNTITDDLNFLTASKTGFTNLSGGNLFVAVQKGLRREIFILVLNSTEKNRFVDVQNIASFLLQSSI